MKKIIILFLSCLMIGYTVACTATNDKDKNSVPDTASESTQIGESDSESPERGDSSGATNSGENGGSWTGGAPLS